MSRRDDLEPIYTIGHSTRTLDEFMALLREQGIARLADIRRYPGSRRYPHFSHQSLAEALPRAGIDYVHVPELGGRRRPLADSPNVGWRNEQFRGYADYMGTPEFRAALDRLLESSARMAILCAEAVPWRCHRNLVADELTRRGIEVLHILGPGSVQRHAMNAMARVVGDRIVYV
ncbi:MAG TPA: DUF488 domain-containing protein [Thermoanaerobaculia bacterium]|nr:DUF488 domain-containing protein [Thermoanaerobaculia bacterium]